MFNQNTLKQAIKLSGIGVHSGDVVNLAIHPAPVDSGITFRRVDPVTGAVLAVIPARWDRVVDTRLCTVIADDSGKYRVGTIEHLMAALRGCYIDNATIDIDGAEVPILDGSSKVFIEHIDAVDVMAQDAPRTVIRVVEPIEFMVDDKLARFDPMASGDFGPAFDFEINFDHKMIGHQKTRHTLINGCFRHDIAKARTFGFMRDVEALRAIGLARGGSLDNAIVLDDTGILNEGDLRFDDEFVRHKALDAIGDVYLAGCQIMGHYCGVKAGHDVNNKLLHVLFRNPDKWEYATQDDVMQSLQVAGTPVAQYSEQPQTLRYNA